jgi:hypothetical protein
MRRSNDIMMVQLHGLRLVFCCGLESAHWGNAQLAQMETFEIVRTEEDQQVINGVQTFSLNAINRLLEKYTKVRMWRGLLLFDS